MEEEALEGPGEGWGPLTVIEFDSAVHAQAWSRHRSPTQDSGDVSNTHRSQRGVASRLCPRASEIQIHFCETGPRVSEAKKVSV